MTVSVDGAKANARGNTPAFIAAQAAQGLRVVSAQDPRYGLVADGVSDCYSGLAAALTDLAGGGVLYVPSGRYYLSAGLEVRNHDVRVVGAGASSVLVTDQAIKMLAFTNTADLSANYDNTTFLRGCEASNLAFEGAGQTADGVYVNGVVGGKFTDLMGSSLNSIVFQKHADTCLFERIATPDIENAALDCNYGVYSDGTVRSNDNEYTRVNMRADVSAISLGASAGEHDGANIHDCTIFRCDTGPSIYVKAAKWSAIADNRCFLPGGDSGIYLENPSHVAVTGNLVAWAGHNRSTVTHGVHVKSGAGTVLTEATDITISDNQIIQPSGHGVFVEALGGVSVTDNLIGNASDDQYYTGGTSIRHVYDAIRLETVRDYNVAGNTTYRVLSGQDATLRPITWNRSLYTSATCRDGRVGANAFREGRVLHLEVAAPYQQAIYAPTARTVRALQNDISPYASVGWSNVTAATATVGLSTTDAGFPVASPAIDTAIQIAFPTVTSTPSLVEAGATSVNSGEPLRVSGWARTTSSDPVKVRVELAPNGGTKVTKDLVLSTTYQYFDLALVSDATAGYSVLGFGVYDAQSAATIRVAGLQVLRTLDPVYPVHKQAFGSAAPTAGQWHVGDSVTNTAVAAGGSPGWVCVSQGVPGTWKAMANVAA